MNQLLFVPERAAILVPRHPGLQTAQFSRTLEVTHEGIDYTVVPDDNHSVARLRAMGYRLRNSVGRQYTWSGRFQPFTHQRRTAEFLCDNPRAFVFNEIGTCKTLAALWACDFLRATGGVNKVLIASTLSTLWRVWADHLFIHFPHLTFAVLHGSKTKRLKLLNQDFDFYIINHDGLKVLGDELVARPDIKHVILDEGAEFSNAKTDKYKALMRVAGSQTGRSLWWMTGSPMPGAPTDVWSQARMVNPELVPRYFTRFRDMVMTQRNQFLWVPKPGFEQQIYAMLKPSIRFTRDECPDLPPCVTEMREVGMSAEQQSAYDQMKKEYIIELAKGLITAANEGVKVGKLLQIATGSVYDSTGGVHNFKTSQKDAVLLQTLRESGNKLIVFTPFRHSIAGVAERLKKYSVGIIHGGVSPTKRDKIFAEFQDGDLQVLLAHPKTMAHGLTLTASHTILWWGPTDFRTYEQATGRITRPGQTMKQTIVQLVCSDIEERAYKRLARKEKMQGLLLELLNS